MRTFKIQTNHLVFFEWGCVIEFDGKKHYTVNGDTTNRKLPKEIVENNDMWFKEITDEN